MEKRLQIVSADDVDFWNASVLIMDDGDIYYNPHYYHSGIYNDYSKERIYRIDDIENMQDTFNQLTPEEVSCIDKVNSLNGGFDANAKDAWQVSAYIAYYGCDSYERRHCYSYEDMAKMLGVDNWSYGRMESSELWGALPKEDKQ